MQDAGDIFSGCPVTEGIHRSAHALGPGLVGEGGVEQFAETLGPGLLLIPDEYGDAGGDRFRALGVASENEQRLVKRWGFFLNATGIGNEQPGVLEQVNEIGIVERFDEMNAILAAQFGFGGGADVGIGMNGEDSGNIVVLAHEVAQGA